MSFEFAKHPAGDSEARDLESNEPLLPGRLGTRTAIRAKMRKNTIISVFFFRLAKPRQSLRGWEHAKSVLAALD